MMGNSASPPSLQDSKTPSLSLATLPPQVLDELRRSCKLSDEQITDILEAMQQGVRSPAELLGFTPEVFNTMESMALGFYRSRHYAYAASFYGFLLELDVNRATAWRGLGACNQALKLYPTAVFCYQNALELTPNDVASKVFLGEVFCLLNKPSYGLQLLQEVLQEEVSGPALAPYRTRAQSILRAHHIDPVVAPAASEATTAPKPNDAVPQDPDDTIMGGLDEKTIERLTAQFAAGGDERAIFEEPQVKKLVASLAQGVRRERITIKDVAGFTDEQMHGGYVAACQYLDMGQPLMSMHIIGWLLFIDARNPSYYLVAGLCAQHLKLWCFADYLYGLSLIYDDQENPNPVTMIYRGEAKIFSEERHAGLELLRDGLARCGKDPEQQEAAKRARALLTQFGSKDERSTNRAAP